MEAAFVGRYPSRAVDFLCVVLDTPTASIPCTCTGVVIIDGMCFVVFALPRGEVFVNSIL